MLNGISRRPTMAMTQTKMTRLKMERKLDFPPFFLPPKPRRNCFSWLAVTIKLSFFFLAAGDGVSLSKTAHFALLSKEKCAGKIVKLIRRLSRRFPKFGLMSPRAAKLLFLLAPLTHTFLKGRKQVVNSFHAPLPATLLPPLSFILWWLFGKVQSQRNFFLFNIF